MKLKTKLSIIFLVLIVVSSIWAFVTSMNITKQYNKEFTGKEIAKEEVKINKLVITETRDGKKYWELFAEKGQYDDTKNVVKLEQVFGNFYKDNKVVMSFEAPGGEYSDQHREVKLTGGGKVLSDDGTLIKATQIIWAGAVDKVYASGNVKIVKTDKFITYSDKSVFNTAFTEFEISGKTESKVYKK